MRSPEESDALASTTELLHQARNGDTTALDRLFNRLYPHMQRWTRGRLPPWARDLADTDDLVQEALVQTFKKLDGFESRGTGALQAYVRQAILNRIRDELRKKNRRPEPVEFDEGVEFEAGDAGGLSPLDHAIGREAVERYERCLSRLARRDREAVIGRVEMGFDYHELADMLGTPTVDAARKVAERAIVKLADAMRRDADGAGR